MRVGLFIGSAILAGAGVAVAQSSWVVDPWSSSSTTPSEQRSSEPDLTPASQGWFGSLPAEWADPRSTEPTDPWSSAAPEAPSSPLGQATPAAADTPLASAAGAWAKPVPLVVDPWTPERVRARARAVDLIVDPWARDKPSR